MTKAAAKAAPVVTADEPNGSTTLADEALVDTRDPPFTEEQAQALAADLVSLDVVLRAEGSSVAMIIATAAKNSIGIDVR